MPEGVFFMKVQFENFIYLSFGVAITVIFFNRLPSIKEKVSKMTQKIRSYWIISIMILLISAGLNILNYLYAPNNQRDYLRDLISFYSGLFFAIFTGYFAFTEFQLNRFEKLVEEAVRELRDEKYPRAQKLYEQAHLIKPTDPTVINNLAEIYLISRNDEAFEKMISKIDCIDKSENILLFYLQSAWKLLDENIGGSKKYLKKLAVHIAENPTDINKFSWSFSDIKNSDPYKNLKGESRETLDLLIDLLEKKEKKAEEDFIEKFLK